MGRLVLCGSRRSDLIQGVISRGRLRRALRVRAAPVAPCSKFAALREEIFLIGVVRRTSSSGTFGAGRGFRDPRLSFATNEACRLPLANARVNSYRRSPMNVPCSPHFSPHYSLWNSQRRVTVKVVPCCWAISSSLGPISPDHGTTGSKPRASEDSGPNRLAHRAEVRYAN